MTVGPFELGACYAREALGALRELPAASIEAIITDPPYNSGGQYRGDRAQRPSTKYVNTDSRETCRFEFTGDNRDQRSYTVWVTMWATELFRVARACAPLLVFTDWRQLPATSDAIQCAGWVWRNIVTWWKPGVRMQRGRFSLSAEYIITATKGPALPGESSPQNVLSCQPVPGVEKEHVAQKPAELLRQLMGVTTAGALVLDPFTGSGTTGVACVETGRRFLGFEIDPEACRRANERIRAARAGVPASEHRAGQQPLFTPNGQEAST